MASNAAFTHIIPDTDADGYDYICKMVDEKHKKYFIEFAAGTYMPPMAKSWGHATDIIVQHLSKRLEANIKESVEGMKKHRKQGAINLVFACFLMDKSHYDADKVNVFGQRFDEGQDLYAMCKRISRKYDEYEVNVFAGPLVGGGGPIGLFTSAMCISISRKPKA